MDIVLHRVDSGIEENSSHRTPHDARKKQRNSDLGSYPVSLFISICLCICLILFHSFVYKHNITLNTCYRNPGLFKCLCRHTFYSSHARHLFKRFPILLEAPLIPFLDFIPSFVKLGNCATILLSFLTVLAHCHCNVERQTRLPDSHKFVKRKG